MENRRLETAAPLTADRAEGGSETLPYFFGQARGMPDAVRADWNSARSAGVARTERGEVFFERQNTARAPTDSPMFHSTGWRR